MARKYRFLFLSLFMCNLFLCYEAQASLCCEKTDPCCPQEGGAAFITIGGGYSWSYEGSIRASPKFWDASPQGYNNDLKRSEVYTAGLGYHFRPLVSLLFEVGYRPNYKYRKFQTSTAFSTPGFLGTKTRHFRLSSLSFTFNVFLNKEGNCLQWKLGKCYAIAPFIGGGVGVSYNDLYDFYSSVPKVGQVSGAASIENNKVHAAFAAQAMAGFVNKVTERFSFDIGYRWFYGGRILSNNYTTDYNVVSGVASPPEYVSPWKGVLGANEIFINLNYSL